MTRGGGAVRGKEQWERGWEWPEWTFGKPPTSRRERIGAVVGPSIFLAFLAAPLSDAFGESHPLWWRLAVVACVVCYAATYSAALVRGNTRRLSSPERSCWIGVLCGYPILLAVLGGPDLLVFATFAVSAALMCLPRNLGGLIGFGFTLALAVGSEVSDGSINWPSVLVLALLTLCVFVVNAWTSTMRQLKRAQVEMAEMAVAEERSRLARDLHDVLGHSLTTITVKAGLARRVLESSADRERAIAEVRDVEELARQTMAEVRATVSGYRTPSLAAELVGARAALQAAGIAADLPQAVDNVAVVLREPFAYVVREGVTNVVRHSGATRCEVRLGENWVEVRDNGNACGDAVRHSRANGGGHGLTGLAERVASVAGTIEAGPLPEGGFLLKVSTKTPVTPRADTGEREAVGGADAAKPWVAAQ